MARSIRFIAILSVLVLFMTSCPNPATPSDPPADPPKDWASASIVDKLLADDGAGSDVFGYSVDISGDTAIVGAYGNDDKGSNSGSVYIFQQDAAAWSQVQKLIATDGAAEDRFGASVAISGDTAIVGAYLEDAKGSGSGSVYVFQQDAGVWSQSQKLTASDGAADDRFGVSVAISGDTAIVGAYTEDAKGSSSGSVYMFQEDAGIWSQVQKLVAEDGGANNYLGYSVDISGDTVIAGAYGDDDNGNGSGSVYLFERDAGVWSQSQKIIADDGTAGDVFGREVAIFGDTAIVGAYQDDDNGTNSGSAYILQKVAGVWTQVQKLIAVDNAADDWFGASVAISGDTAIVGASQEDAKGSNSGSVYVFQQDAGVWSQAHKLTADDGAIGDNFGFSVAIFGETTIISASADDDNGPSSGSAYIIE